MYYQFRVGNINNQEENVIFATFPYFSHIFPKLLHNFLDFHRFLIIVYNLFPFSVFKKYFPFSVFTFFKTIFIFPSF
jgi:hypothetical protein